ARSAAVAARVANTWVSGRQGFYRSLFRIGAGQGRPLRSVLAGPSPLAGCKVDHPLVLWCLAQQAAKRRTQAVLNRRQEQDQAEGVRDKTRKRQKNSRDCGKHDAVGGFCLVMLPVGNGGTEPCNRGPPRTIDQENAEERGGEGERQRRQEAEFQ